MAFIKTGMRPREFAEMDRYEKAIVIGFLKEYSKDNDKATKKPRRRGRRGRR